MTTHTRVHIFIDFFPTTIENKKRGIKKYLYMWIGLLEILVFNFEITWRYLEIVSNRIPQFEAYALRSNTGCIIT